MTGEKAQLEAPKPGLIHEFRWPSPKPGTEREWEGLSEYLFVWKICTGRVLRCFVLAIVVPSCRDLSSNSLSEFREVTTKNVINNSLYLDSRNGKKRKFSLKSYARHIYTSRPAYPRDLCHYKSENIIVVCEGVYRKSGKLLSQKLIRTTFYDFLRDERCPLVLLLYRRAH